MRAFRIQIAGSASPNANGHLLSTAHEFVRSLSDRLIDLELGLVLGIGDEPIGRHGLSCTFDWTIIESITATSSGSRQWPSDRPGRFRVVGSQRALERIPISRRTMWDSSIRRSDFELQLSPSGWRMGGVIRAQQVRSGDVLVVIGGGAGVEQLAQLYLDEGKSVVPVKCDIGSSVGDGSGGSSHLYGQALSETSTFFDLHDGAGSSTSRLSGLRVEADSEPSALAEATASLISDLKPPNAFYVRLLAKELDEFRQVEKFFREAVDPVVTGNGFTPYEVGRNQSQTAFINVEIFEQLHRAALVVADLTGVRPNCTMELGYALARHRRVLITAMKGTRLPFDSDKLPTHFWDSTQPKHERRDAFHSWFDRHIDMPAVVI